MVIQFEFQYNKLYTYLSAALLCDWHLVTSFQVSCQLQADLIVQTLLHYRKALLPQHIAVTVSFYLKLNIYCSVQQQQIISQLRQAQTSGESAKYLLI